MNWNPKSEKNWGLLGMKFKTEKLGQYLYIKGRIGWKGLKKNEYLNEGEYRIINGESLSSDGIDWNKAGYITEERYEESPEIKLQENDILISKDGTIGKIGFVKKLSKPSTVASGIFVIRNNNKEQIDTRFIYHFLRSPYFRNFIKARTEGSVIPHLYQKDFVELDFPLCSLREQKKISSILDVIDEKIQVNKEINDNLAYQNQAILYNFMEKHPYHLQPLSDIAIVIDCLHSKKPSSVENSEYQLIQLDNIKDNGFLDMSSCQYMISHEDYVNWTRRCEIVEGDCVITNVGRIGAVSQAPCGTKAAMGRNMTCLRLKPEAKLHAYFITVLLSQHMRRQILQNTDEGTILGALNVKNIPKLLFPIFESSVLAQLEETLFPLRKQIEFNSLQNQRLIQLRDSLLPKLMSGELDISNIDI